MIKVMTTKKGEARGGKHECNVVHAGGDDDMINDDIRFLYKLQKRKITLLSNIKKKPTIS